MDESKGNHIIRFTASWCGPCRMYAPVFEAVVANRDNLVSHVIDIDDDPANLAAEYKILSVPTTVMVRDGGIVESISGAVTASRLNTLINEHFS